MVYQSSDPCEVKTGKLNEVIKSSCFQLHTLYCDSYQDLEGIIASQEHLRLLGIFNDDIFDYRIFMLTWSERSYGKLDQLTLFPELCLPGQTFTLCRDIATSLVGRDLGKCQNVGPEDHNFKLTIHVFDFSYAKTAIICEVVEAMAQHFVDCQVFAMKVQTSVGKETVSKPWRISGVSTSVNQFKQLQRLDFYVYSSDPSQDSLSEAAIDLRSFLLEEFVIAGLREVRVYLDDHDWYARLSPYPDILSWEILLIEGISFD
ncbi:hypothetical protein JOM56_012445 [Amanita muscaria]